MNSCTDNIKLAYCGGGTPEEWLLWKDKLLQALRGQGISTGLNQYNFTRKLLKDDAKATLNQAALDIDVCDVDNYRKILLEMNKYSFSSHASCKQQSYFCRFIIEHMSMKLCTFIDRL